MDYKIKLISERLILRSVQFSDAEEIFAYRSDKLTNKFQGWIPESIEEVKSFINEKICKDVNIPDTWHQLAIVEKESQKIIGDFGIHFIDEDGYHAEIGFTLNKNFQGKGFASEAVKTVLNYLFNELNKHRITGSVDPENVSSIKLLFGVGFTKEAHFRKSLLINNQWCDDVIFAMLKEDWGK